MHLERVDSREYGKLKGCESVENYLKLFTANAIYGMKVYMFMSPLDLPEIRDHNRVFDPKRKF
jgi:hypothetical protein